MVWDICCFVSFGVTAPGIVRCVCVCVPVRAAEAAAICLSYTIQPISIWLMLDENGLSISFVPPLH